LGWKGLGRRQRDILVIRESVEAVAVDLLEAGQVLPHTAQRLQTFLCLLIHRLVMDETGECKISPEAKVMIYLDSVVEGNKD